MIYGVMNYACCVCPFRRGALEAGRIDRPPARSNIACLRELCAGLKLHFFYVHLVPFAPLQQEKILFVSRTTVNELTLSLLLCFFEPGGVLTDAFPLWTS